MRILLILLIFMVGLVGTIQAVEFSDQKTDKIQNVDISLKDQFLANNWEIIIPNFIKQNEEFKKIYGKELGLKAIIIIDAKTKSVKIRFTNMHSRQTAPLKMIVRDNMLYFTSENSGGIMEIKRKDGKLICIPMNNDKKTGESLTSFMCLPMRQYKRVYHTKKGTTSTAELVISPSLLNI